MKALFGSGVMVERAIEAMGPRKVRSVLAQLELQRVAGEESAEPSSPLPVSSPKRRRTHASTAAHISGCELAPLIERFDPTAG